MPARVRAWTIQLTCEDRAPSAALLTAFAKLAQSDPSGMVRLYLASAVQRIDVVFDSLAKNGGNAQQLDPIKALLVTGDVQGIAQRFGFGGG